ncbi:MAG TPA: hypothetical protein VMF66_05610 [Candidatus Acidoferrum sp.]|nr:hypothetical protein [Candidatus Acidoferrum sp.]
MEVDGITYNLKSGPDGVQYELARPVIRRDERGKITGVQARSRPEAEQSAADLIRKGKAEEVNITESQGKTFHDIKLTVDLSYNPDLYRLAAKLVGNMAISIGLETFVRDSGLGSYLHGSREWKVSTGFCDTSSLRRLRPGLSHTIYLELGTPSRAVVIFFGGMQIFLPLPPASKDAFLGFLDPLSGEESFARVNALNINQPPEVVTESQARFWLAEINRYFSEEANARGAKHPPNLSVSGIDLGKPGASYVFVPVWRSKAKLWFTI